jgi:hypothetical protein
MYFKYKGEFWSIEGMMNKYEGQPFTLSDLLFADDAEIVARDAKELQLILDTFVEVTVAFGQEVSIPKTKGIRVERRTVGNVVIPPSPLVDIMIGDEALDYVDEFIYVGGGENNCGTMSHEVRKRLSSMFALFHFIFNRNISLRTKLSVFESVVMANGLYGCST